MLDSFSSSSPLCFLRAKNFKKEILTMTTLDERTNDLQGLIVFNKRNVTKKFESYTFMASINLGQSYRGQI